LLEAVRSIHGFSQGHSITYATMIALRNLSNILPLISAFYQRYSGIDAVFGAPLRNQAHLKDYPDLAGEGRKDLLSKVLLHQHSGGLVNLLHYGDAISMANSIESRNPFMDYRLVEFALALPSDYIIRRGIGKSIHREAMLGRVPTYILNCKEKIGFTTPIGRILTLRGGGGALPAPVDALLSDHCLARGMFERDGMANIIAAHREGRHDHGNLLYRLLSTEIWFRVFIDSSTAAVAT
jgi:asparagine synthase (glutamine-hydrolysing)